MITVITPAQRAIIITLKHTQGSGHSQLVSLPQITASHNLSSPPVKCIKIFAVNAVVKRTPVSTLHCLFGAAGLKSEGCKSSNLLLSGRATHRNTD